MEPKPRVDSIDEFKIPPDSSAEAFEALDEEPSWPVKPLEPEPVSTGRKSEKFPPNTFSTHEGLIAFKGPEEDSPIQLLPSTQASRAWLTAKGYADGYSNYGVPFTGAELEDRATSEDWPRMDRILNYTAGATEAGLNKLDYSELTPEQRAKLSKIGYHGSTIKSGYLLSGEINQFTVSEGHRAPDTAERAEHIGKFAVVDLNKSDPNYITMPESTRLWAIAYTDQAGNQVIAPASEELFELLEQLNYTSVDEPTFDVGKAVTDTDPHNRLRRSTDLKTNLAASSRKLDERMRKAEHA